MTKNTTVSTSQAAKQLGVSKVTVIRMFHDGHLTGYRKNPLRGNSPIRIHQTSIDAVLAARR